MKWLSAFLLGYMLLMIGLFLALWKLGALDGMDRTWRWITGLVVVGVGVMISVSKSGRKETIEIDSK